ncbi:MAG: hypothetical protein Q9182_002546 [Xanthomendoza sp. 2 TL-2023]
MAFVMLGFALENMTGAPYAEILQSTIFDPLGMHRASLTKPADKEGIIPSQANDWNADIGTYGPTGGIYTTAADLALFARSILTNKQLDKAASNAWFHPRSYSSSWSFAYGMPWEIFRTSDMLADSDRIQTIFTKAGALRGYSSQLLMIPEYDLGIVVLVAGDRRALPWLREEILKTLVPAVEQVARDQAADRIMGLYVSGDSAINSSVSIELESHHRLVVTSWISNGTDFLATYTALLSQKNESGILQLTPARIGRGKNGEVWRSQFVQDRFLSEGIISSNLIEDVDTMTLVAQGGTDNQPKTENKILDFHEVNVVGYQRSVHLSVLVDNKIDNEVIAGINGKCEYCCPITLGLVVKKYENSLAVRFYFDKDVRSAIDHKPVQTMALQCHVNHLTRPRDLKFKAARRIDDLTLGPKLKISVKMKRWIQNGEFCFKEDYGLYHVAANAFMKDFIRNRKRSRKGEGCGLVLRDAQ